MIFVAILVVMKTKQKQFSLLSIPSELDITKAKFPFSLKALKFNLGRIQDLIAGAMYHRGRDEAMSIRGVLDTPTFGMNWQVS